MTKSNFKNSDYDVISVTSSFLRHRKTSQTIDTKFFHLGPSQSKFLATPLYLAVENETDRRVEQKRGDRIGIAWVADSIAEIK